jgi:fumarate hydratase class I
MAFYDLTLPILERTIRALHAGDRVHLSGVMVTGRDAAHKYLCEMFVSGKEIPGEDRALCKELEPLLRGGVLYHCGPVVRQTEEGKWQFIAAGPTTSAREEAYEPAIIARFGLRGIVGKGGMGPATLRACREHGAAYFCAVGGAGSLMAATVKDVISVHKLAEFGAPEALWVIRVEHFPAVVTMDSHGRSIHADIADSSKEALDRLIGRREPPPGRP